MLGLPEGLEKFYKQLQCLEEYHKGNTTFLHLLNVIKIFLEPCHTSDRTFSQKSLGFFTR